MGSVCDRPPQPQTGTEDVEEFPQSIGIPQRGTHIPEFGCPGIHVVQELSVHCHPSPDLWKGGLNPDENLTEPRVFRVCDNSCSLQKKGVA